ncbi:MAG: gliding motility-associated C-terminal domain-containing protein, partial [Chitinophagaceae bacterium]
DNDGIPDEDEAGNPANPVDTDQDNKPDYRDQDSNSDGIPDGETLLIYKSSSAPRLLTDGTYEVRFSITVKNYRDQPLTNVQVKDNLSLTFISPVQYKVVSYTVSGTTLIRNTGFDGKTNTDLLASGSTLAGNGVDSILLVVNVDPKGYSGALNNTAIGTAVSKWGAVTRESIDLSLSNGVQHGNGIASRFYLAPIDLVIPDVITPNGDGFNDRWVIRHPSTLQLSVTVFNRWGQEVYKNSDYNNEWDGRGSGSFLGKNLPNGTYFYVVELIEIATGQKEIRKGALTLKRPY